MRVLSGRESFAPAVVVEGLRVRFDARDGQKEVLSGASLTVHTGRVTCLVGASGSGKSVLTKALLGVLPGTPGVVAGRVRLEVPGVGHVEVLEGLSGCVTVGDDHWRVRRRWRRVLRRRMRPLWGRVLGYVPQDWSRALDPTRPVGTSLGEAMVASLGPEAGHRAARKKGEALLARLRFSRPDLIWDKYPDELSGGMAQRVSIAVCLARGAKTVFADEPASGLDRESRESLLELLEELHLAGDLTTLVLVTHDFEVAGRIGHRLVVMDEGKVIEQGEVSDILGIPGPSHPRTRRLLEDFRRLEIPRVKVASNKGGPPRLRVQDIWCSYRSPWRFGRRRREAVLKGANLEVCPGEVVGLVGPSGSGKTTLAGVVVRLVTPDRGSVDLEGTDLLALDGAVLRAKRRELQLLFQQVRAAIHPRMRVREALMETATWVRCLGPGDARREVDRVLRAVDLADLVDAFPSHLSGGELRRVGIARVLLARPRLLIVDEPTVGVDASLRAGVLELLDDLRRRRDGPSILLISHDWKVVNHLCDRIYEIRDGRLFPAPRDGRGPASPEPRRRSPGCRKEKGATP